MGRHRRTKRTLLLFVLGLLLLQVPLQEQIHRLRPGFDPNRPDRASSIVNVQGPTTAIIAALGGFRTVAADLLWMKVDQLWDGGNVQYLPTLLESVVQLDPHFILAWKVYGWHLAYNLNAESLTTIDKRYWLNEGTKVLERAIAINPQSWEAQFELGWTLYDRAHEYPKAADVFLTGSKMRGAPSYLDRLYYRSYEHMLDLDGIKKALAYARSRLDLFPGENQHQRLVRRDSEFWSNHWTDPETHRRIIVDVNSSAQQRSVEFSLFPDNPYWDVCPQCGMPSHRGRDEVREPLLRRTDGRE